MLVAVLGLYKCFSKRGCTKNCPNSDAKIDEEDGTGKRTEKDDTEINEQEGTGKRKEKVQIEGKQKDEEDGTGNLNKNEKEERKKREEREEEAQREWKQREDNWVILLFFFNLFLMFPSVVRTMIDATWCRKLGPADADVSVLVPFLTGRMRRC